MLKPRHGVQKGRDAGRGIEFDVQGGKRHYLLNERRIWGNLTLITLSRNWPSPSKQQKVGRT